MLSQVFQTATTLAFKESKIMEIMHRILIFKKTGKVIEVEKGELDKGIEKLIKHHSELQEKFKNAMSEKFKNLILGPTKKKKSYVSEIIIGSAVVLSTALSFLHYKINKEAKYESSTNQQTTKIK